MLKKTLAALAVLAVIGGAADARAERLKEINFGIISTESSTNLKTIWEPFLKDMEKNLGMKVNAFFAPDYAGVIEGMRFNKVDIAWYGNKSAMEAVDRAGAEIFVQTVAADGAPGYWSLLLTHKDNDKINNLEDVLKCDQSLNFGNGDPNSTSGFLVPSYYVFAVNKVDPKKCYKTARNAGHEANALAVANKQVDFATGNTENMDRLQKTNPEAFAKIKVIWKSPLIPSDPIAWRKNLEEADKKTIKAFFMDYGRKDGAQKEQQVSILKGLQWAPFRESSDAQLYPIRQLELFKARAKVEGDEKMDSSERAKKLAEFDVKLAEIKSLAEKQH